MNRLKTLTIFTKFIMVKFIVSKHNPYNLLLNQICNIWKFNDDYKDRFA